MYRLRMPIYVIGWCRPRRTQIMVGMASQPGELARSGFSMLAAHQNHLGELLKRQMPRPYPRELWFNWPGLDLSQDGEPKSGEWNVQSMKLTEPGASISMGRACHQDGNTRNRQLRLLSSVATVNNHLGSLPLLGWPTSLFRLMHRFRSQADLKVWEPFFSI